MKRSDRRFATLIDDERQVSNKTENKRRGLSSRSQYHRLLMLKNNKNKKFKERSHEAVELTFENTVSHIQIPKYVRHYITQTNQEMIQEEFKDLVPSWLFSGGPKACSTYYDSKKSNYVWRPIKFTEGISNLSIYYTLVNRMDYIQELIDRYPSVPAEVSMALLEIQDSYQLLSLHMEMKNCYFDSQLEQVEESTTAVSAAELYNPDMGAPFGISELPDILEHVINISFWSENDGYSTDNLLVQRILFLLYKCLPYPYKRRSIENAVVESWSDIMQRVFLKNADKNEQEKERMKYERDFTSDLYQVAIRIIMGSLLRVYEHCQTRANFRTRRKIYKWFCLNRPNQEEMSQWILKYKELILCSFREYMFYMTDKVGGVSDYLGGMSYWNILKYTTFESMDNAIDQLNVAIDRYSEDYTVSENGLESMWNDLDMFCARLSNKYYSDQIFATEPGGFEWYPGLSWFYKIQYDLDVSNRGMLKNTNRPKTDTFERMVLTKMNEIESKMKKGAINNQSVDPDFLSQEIKDHIKEKIEEADQFEKIPYQCLGDVPVRLGSQYLYMLQEAEGLYEYEEGSVELKDTLSLFYNKMPYEYQVLKYFFTLLTKKQGLAIYYGTTDMYEKQMEGLNRIYETQEGQPLDSSAGLYYLCKNCNNIKIVVRDVSSINNPNSIGGWSSDGVCICLDDEKFYCSYLNSKDTPKKRDPTKLIIKNMFTGKEDRGLDADVLNVKRLMDLQDVKDLRKYVTAKDRVILDKYIEKRQLQEDCLNKELTPIYLPGHFVHIQDKTVVACPQCLHPVYYSRQMFRNGVENMSCGCKDKKSEADFSCFVCKKECHDYCFVKAIWDDGMSLSDIDNQLPFKYVCLCQDHKSLWTNELDMIPKASQLDRLVKRVKAKFNKDGKLIINEKESKEQTEPKPIKKKKTSSQEHSEYLSKKRKLDIDNAAIAKKKEKKEKIKTSLDKRMKMVKSKNRDSVKKMYNVEKAPTY